MHDHATDRPTPPPRAVVRSRLGVSPSHALLGLQRTAGNAAVALAVQRKYAGFPYIDFGLLSDDCGTEMRAELHPGKLEKGSKPAVRPSWWPKSGSMPTKGGEDAADFFSTYMVQGHLLNEKVGGTGKSMENLTPLTKSANSQHHSKVEKRVKSEVKKNKHVVEYHVTAQYGKHPNAKDMGATGAAAKYIDDNFTDMMAGKLRAEYTVYKKTAKGGKELFGDAWEITNEGK
ncbi:DNA/RNA non-specific endonuclease [Phytomonospora endophytica]|uniref:Type VII secretion system protein EssD-like domain-containing protein n=1 Tax=Phytomonospora endophytica TaxID=714109 RepID=A0A841FN22_9ACTN|nr:DNA/RNA non-specific endonuclease [Phytomonospora endophytica]MBB6038711.1 hypothetical protein [Phytomonospora endophytica]GIG68492.1 hypothetical protein Pen01_47870 [Phytomonospora endophytica]